MLRHRLTRIALWLLALNMLVQPALVALPPGVIHAAVDSSENSVERTAQEVLTAIVPGPSMPVEPPPQDSMYPVLTEPLGQESPAYYIQRGASEHSANNPAHNFRVRFTPQGVHIQTPDG